MTWGRKFSSGCWGFGATNRSINVHRGLHALDLGGLRIHIGDQLRLGGGLQRDRTGGLLDAMRAKKTASQGECGKQNDDCGISRIKGHVLRSIRYLISIKEAG